MKELSQDGKEELAVALLLWKDFKTDGKMDIEITKQAIGLAEHLGISSEFDKMHAKMPPVKITVR